VFIHHVIDRVSPLPSQPVAFLLTSRISFSGVCPSNWARSQAQESKYSFQLQCKQVRVKLTFMIWSCFHAPQSARELKNIPSPNWDTTRSLFLTMMFACPHPQHLCTGLFTIALNQCTSVSHVLVSVFTRSIRSVIPTGYHPYAYPSSLGRVHC
jgi:hypothetical protein